MLVDGSIRDKCLSGVLAKRKEDITVGRNDAVAVIDNDAAVRSQSGLGAMSRWLAIFETQETWVVLKASPTNRLNKHKRDTRLPCKESSLFLA